MFSLEKPKAKLLPFKGPNGEDENPSDYQVTNFSSIFTFVTEHLRPIFTFVTDLISCL